MAYLKVVVQESTAASMDVSHKGGKGQAQRCMECHIWPQQLLF